MTYNYDTKSCTCGTDADGTEWVNAGSDWCITKAEKDKMTNDGYYGTGSEEKVTYFNLKKANGEDDGEQTVDSEVFKQFYLRAAVGCQIHQDQEMCQVLANLCVL